MKSALILSISLGLGTAHASTIFFDYSASGAGQGSGTNNIVTSMGGETVTATAWAVTGNSATFETATLGDYTGYGLGVCNPQELAAQGGCGSPQHEVDDNGQFDFVLFQFSTAVTSVQITLDPVCNCNTDASYYAGNGLTPSGHTLAQLGTSTTSNQASPDTTRTVTLTGLGSGVNSVLFGASIFGNNNYFKIESLTVTEQSTTSNTPEPATFGLAGLALIFLGVIGNKRRNAKARQ